MVGCPHLYQLVAVELHSKDLGSADLGLMLQEAGYCQAGLQEALVFAAEERQCLRSEEFDHCSDQGSCSVMADSHLKEVVN